MVSSACQHFLPARREAVQPTAVAPIHALTQDTGVGVASQVGGVGITGGFLVRAIHSSFLPLTLL